MGSFGCGLVDVLVNRLMCESDQHSDYQLHLVRLRSDSVRLRSSSTSLMQLQSLSPWELRTLWARVSVFAINKAQFPPFQAIVRVGLKGLLVVIDTVFYNFATLKKLWRLMVWCNCVWAIIV